MPVTVQPQCMIQECHQGEQAGVGRIWWNGGLMLQASNIYKSSKDLQTNNGL